MSHSTAVARTWLDCAGMLTRNEPIVMADQIVSEHRRSFGPPRLVLVPLKTAQQAMTRGLSRHR
ncbi:hypothetical protein MUK71_05350 [Arthrobacter zhangbolii]|uniref:Uncharacterized protein n=1 Tax=Arthrobacter zhangbolii TaxID=2886936 RepID=A0ABY4DLS7_9MICC|nr:hypothetical protein [Arthrobacter zhangbolii]MCC3295342.1 hypothetical protein [Arthrobacter zhangbolii]UON93051.1 hypothetical protein MUK71_05350 [Arthrobacter zhangbolii]